MHDSAGSDEGIGLVHLVWAPLGREPLREFLRSYRAHPSGIAHELVIVLNGAAPGAEQARPASTRRSAGRASGPRGGRTLTREDLQAELTGIEHRLIALDRPVLDLAAYGLAARELEHGRLCFLNSYSVVLADNWLAMLADALMLPDVGLAGASGSWESQAEWIRGPVRHWPSQLLRVRSARRDYPRFPNPHVRTSGFAIEREAVLSLGLQRAADKRDTYLLESGGASITRQILDRALRPVVVGRDGEVYGIERWPASHTYRSGAQENLLVADRRTRDWERASPRLRRRLSRDAWGERRADSDIVAGPGSDGS
jgi:hypothetical protein